MLTPTERAASNMISLKKCEKCINAITNWRGVKICGKGLSPKRCDNHYRLRKDIAIMQAERAFK